jgi:dihydropteroate synthase
VRDYWLPLPLAPAAPGGLRLAGGWARFDRVLRLRRGARPAEMGAAEMPDDVLVRLTAPRPAVLGLGMDRPRLMGILNVTPDSFSDGGRLGDAQALRRAAEAMAEADILDLGGESTRPGAAEVPPEEEAARVLPALAALAALRGTAPISVDTRKAAVAEAALEAGAGMVNDVSGLRFDPGMAPMLARRGAALCLMHSRGTPADMAGLAEYADPLLDVYDALEAAIDGAEAAGIARARIVADPGIGFAKTPAQSMELIRGLALFHGLGVPLLLGVSRKGLIGARGGPSAARARDRGPGTLALTLAAAAQGVQIHRVHDVAPCAQGLALWRAGTDRGTGEEP